MSTTELSTPNAHAGALLRTPAAVTGATAQVRTGPEGIGDPIAALCGDWRKRAKELRTWASAEGAARALEQCALQLAAALAKRDDRLLGVAEAAALVGRHRDTIGSALKKGRLANYGAKHRPQVRYADVVALFPPRGVVRTHDGAYAPSTDARAFLGPRRGDAV